MEEDGLPRAGEAEATPVPAPSGPAEHVGRYVKCTLLGAGSLADVWLAFDPVMNREVTLKLLVRGTEEERAVAIRGAQSAVGLVHPSCAGVIEVGRSGGTAFIAQEYVRGVPLSKTGVSREEAVRILFEAATAVHHAHQMGLLHRDIKPGNILLDEERHARIVDFDMAPPVDGALRGGGGAPAYAAPELLREPPAPPDERCDVYSLGATLYEAALGRPPYEAATPEETAHLVQRGPPRPPRQIDPLLPVDVETIILKAMARHPARRYPSAGEMAEDLRLHLEGMPVLGRRPGGRLVWILAGAGLVLALAVTAWLMSGGRVSPKDPPPRISDPVLPRDPAPSLPDEKGADAAWARAKDALKRAEELKRSGDTEGWRGSLRTAVGDLDETLKLRPDHPAARLARAKARADLGDAVAGALEDVHRILSVDAQNREARDLRGRLLLERALGRRKEGDWGRVVEDLEAALQDVPALDRARYELANARDMQGDPAGALKEYKALIEKAVDGKVVVLARIAAGWLCVASGDAAAYDHFLAVARSEPKEAGHWDRLVGSAQQDEDWDRMGRFARLWAEEQPNNPQALLVVAISLGQAREFDRAIETATRAELLRADKKQVVERRVGWLERAGRWAEALDDASTLIQLVPGDTLHRVTKVRVLIGLGELADAEREARAILGGGSEAEQVRAKAAATLLLAEIEARRDRPEEALGLLRQAVETWTLDLGDLPARPGFAALRDTEEFRAILEQAKGKLERALKEVPARPFLGINMVVGGSSGARGVALSGTLKGLPARAAGLRPGDRIVSLDGRLVNTAAELGSVIGAKRPGDRVKVRVERGTTSEEKALFEREITLALRPAGK